MLNALYDLKTNATTVYENVIDGGVSSDGLQFPASYSVGSKVSAARENIPIL